MDTFNKDRTELFAKLYSNVGTEEDFSNLALEIFRFQYMNNPVYRSFCDLLKRSPEVVKKIIEIPFLPIQLFKSHSIKTGDWKGELQFKSSGTGGSSSIHHVRQASVYQKNAVYCFEAQFGALEQYRFYALLPSYLENGDSSLVYMAEHFMEKNINARGGFFLHNYSELVRQIEDDTDNRKLILLGVSYALLDLATNNAPDLSNVIIMETGGMKGRAKEIPREELYVALKKGFNTNVIHSEYGMTELMSQAYSVEEGLFREAPVMKVLISDLNDPLTFLQTNRQGRINIIDLANIDSCAFIATDDMGIKTDNQHFKVLGRTDASEMRGCNLLYTDV